MTAPTVSWLWKWPSASVSGLPMSCRRAAIRTIGRFGRRVDRAQGVAPQVLAGGLVLGDAALARQLRGDHGQQARSGHQPQPHRRPRRREQLAQLGATRSPERWPASSALRPIDASVSASISKPSVAASRTRADHAQGVLVEAHVRVADGSQQPSGQVVAAAVRIDERGSARRVRRPRPSR